MLQTFLKGPMNQNPAESFFLYCPYQEGWGPFGGPHLLDFSPCFEHVTFLLATQLPMLIYGSIRLNELATRKKLIPRYYKSNTTLLKLGFAGIIAAIEIAKVIIWITENYSFSIFNALFVIKLLQLATSLESMYFIIYCDTRSRTNSSFLQFYWTFSAIVCLIMLHTEWRLVEYSLFYPTIYYLGAQLISYILLVIIEVYQDKPRIQHRSQHIYAVLDDQDFLDDAERTEIAPEDSANFFSKLAFSWLNPVLNLAFTPEGINEKDLHPLPAMSDTKNSSIKFWKNWEFEVESARNSLFMALVKSFGGWYSVSGLFKLFYDLLLFANPIILKHLLSFVSSYSTEHPMHPGIGFYYAFILLIVNFVQTVLLHQSFNLTYKTGLGVRSVLVTAIYKKSMVLSNKSRSQFNSGDVSNRMSIDSQRINDFLGNAHPLWSSPFQVILALYLLYQTLGWSAYAGVAIMALAVPINTYLANEMQKVQEIQMKSKDDRAHLVEESLQGIKVLKLYAWETPFLQRIRLVRNFFELEALRKIGFIYCLQTIIIIFVPFFVTFATFYCYYRFDNESRGPLNSGLIFVALALFNMLQFPLIILPYALTLYIEARVAIRRIQEYLVAEELEKNAVVKLKYDRKADNIDDEIANHHSIQLQINNVNTLLKSATKQDLNGNAEEDTLVVVKNADLWWDYNPSSSTPSTPISLSSSSLSSSVNRNTNTQPTLKNINLKVSSNELLAVVGRVGTGKSSLLLSLTGELFRSRGYISTKGQVAYVTQQPWIMNDTLRENILFGKKFNSSFYEKVIFACGLSADLSVLADGDQTEIGEKGINLSGGQKARVGLARAVYAGADIYLLDDPLAAVDAHVGAHLFRYVLGPNGLLRNRARIFVTNAIPYLESCDSVVLMQDGNIVEQGGYDTLISENGLLTALVRDYGSQRQGASEASTPVVPQDSPGKTTPLELPQTITGGTTTNSINEACHDRFDNCPEPIFSKNDVDGAFQRRVSLPLLNTRPASIKSGVKLEPPRPQGQLMTVETSNVGKVSSKVYMDYIRACGVGSFILFTITLILSEGIIVLSTAWLKYWAESNENGEDFTFCYLGVYLLLGLVFSVFAGIRSYTFMSVCAINSARKSHENMLSSVFASPMQFFDTTPLGRIINRFSRDQAVIDEELPQSLSDWLVELFLLIFNFAAIIAFLPVFVFIAIPIMYVFFRIQNIYLFSSRDLKRLDAVSKSPIYQHFQESLDGVTTIRSYGQTNRFIKENETRLDNNQKPVYHFYALNRWIAVRLDFMSSIMIFSIAFISVFALVYYDDYIAIDPGIVGMTITYSLVITQSLNWCIRMYCKVETDIISMERIEEYSSLVPEPVNNPEASKNENYGKELLKSHPGWPKLGKVEFIHYSTRYRENLEPVLKDINLEIKAGEKVGIIGRTGSGKSSFTLGLFRIVEPLLGQILIDGVDITKIKLSDLRSRVCIIPQDPVLFSGTIRFNLYPFYGLDVVENQSQDQGQSEHYPGVIFREGHRQLDTDTPPGEVPGDSDLWNALELVNLKQFVETLDGGLDAQLTRFGDNFSVGQKQLICLARALVRKSKIIVLDEATASIDPETDEIIQKTIKNSFKNNTIITIAHRLNTVFDSDRILVLSNGHIVEYDSPEALMQDENSALSSFARQYGLTLP